MKKKNEADKELDAVEAVFWALSHASRRHILVCLSKNDRQMLGGEIADQLSCSWPTTTRHLQVLEQAGLVTVKKNGREKVYELNQSRFNIAYKWLNSVSGK